MGAEPNMESMMNNKFRAAFTIVELIVVITVIAILATVVVVSYGAWRTSTATASVKSDLEHAASAMESSRTFNNTYPLTIPTTFSASSSNTIVLTLPNAKSFCLDGTTSNSTSIKYYIDNLTQAAGATSGTCATRTNLPIPSAVTNITFTAGSATIVVNWVLASPNYASQYLAQCAFDPVYITGLVQQTVNGAATTSASLTGANATTTYYCRVRAMNANGQSDWSNTSAGDTQDHICADTNQHGTYPDCYDYDSFPVGTSIAGYWTTPPDQYLLEDGSAISRTTYADLFAVIGTTYGAGDGSTTFNLPDSRGRTSVNKSTSDTEFTTIGQKYGTKTETLTTAQLPSHTHVQNAHTHSAGGRTEAIGGGTATGWGGTSSALRAGASAYTLDNQYVSVSTDTAVNQNTGGGGSHNNIQPSIVNMFAIKYRPIDFAASSLPAASSIDGYWSTAPTGYLLEDGSAVSRTTYSDLFAAVGTTYGAGNGSTTFNLPDSRGRVAVNLNPSDGEFSSMGQKYGEKQHVLTTLEMPSHTHIQNAHAHTAVGRTDAGGAGYASAWAGVNSGIRSNVNNYTQEDDAVTFAAATATNQSAGGGTGHNEIQPSMTRLSAIKYTIGGAALVASTGTVVGGYWSSVPSGYLAEDGTAVSRTTYSALFALVGTTYGAGNGSTTFNLPDTRGRVIVNRQPSDIEFATIGQKYGTKTETPTIAQIASHTHTQNSHTHTAVGRTDASEGGTAGGWGGAQSSMRANTSNYTMDNQYIAVGATAAVNQSTGGGQSHNNIQPSIVKLFVIKF